jgi:tRNA (cytidine/uridine-2'-O-)-methyltransferase
LRLALYQPDIPQNTGTILRLSACFGLGADIIEPCGFVLTDKRLRRAGMDYLNDLDLVRHRSWDAFLASEPGRLVLLTTRGAARHVDFAFQPGDTLLLGRESAGVPESVHAAVDARVAIPLQPGQRALNVAVAAAVATGEALRQIGGFPDGPPAHEG